MNPARLSFTTPRLSKYRLRERARMRVPFLKEQGSRKVMGEDWVGVAIVRWPLEGNYIIVSLYLSIMSFCFLFWFFSVFYE